MGRHSCKRNYMLLIITSRQQVSTRTVLGNFPYSLFTPLHGFKLTAFRYKAGFLHKKSTAEGEGRSNKKKLILPWNSSYCRRLELYQVWGIQLSIE